MRAKILFVGTLVTALLLTLAPPTAASGSRYAFNLFVPNTAENPSTEDTIRVTGAGTFDTGGSVAASGSFTHFLHDGGVFARGTWKATGFTSFVSFGGGNPGQQGGVLTITVTLFPIGGAPVTGVPMTITCELGTLPGPVEEGTTVGNFTEKTGGFTVFHLVP